MDTGTRTHRQLLVVVGVVIAATLVGMVALWPSSTALPDLGPPSEPLVAAVITDVEREDREPDAVTGGSGAYARVTVEVLEGLDAGTRPVLDVNLDGYPELREGDEIALAVQRVEGEDPQYFIADFQRLPTLGVLVGLFVLAVLAVGRWHGLRSLLGLALSLLIVVRFIVPAILAGQNPPLVALVGAMAVMVITLYLSHGVNAMTTSAIVGTTGALVVTVVLGVIFTDQAKITGFSSDDAVMARFALDGLDLQGLVLAGLIIAALGVLDDVTVSQASTVFALRDADPRQTFPALFGRAMRVGRDHIASVVNTLFLAYAGASLALLVVFSIGSISAAERLNSEVLAEEIVKTVVGSIGLVLAVPLTTALAAVVALREPPTRRLSTATHTHVHGPRSVDAGPEVSPEGPSSV